MISLHSMVSNSVELSILAGELGSEKKCPFWRITRYVKVLHALPIQTDSARAKEIMKDGKRKQLNIKREEK